MGKPTNELKDQFSDEFPMLYHELYRFVRFRIPKKEEADDLVSQTVERAFSRLGQYDPTGGSLTAWTIGIAKNEIKMYWRSRRVELPIEEVEICLRSLKNDPARDAELTIEIERVFDALTPEARALLAMRFIDGMSFDEIARDQQSTPTSLRQRLSRLLKRIRTDHPSRI